MTFQEARRFLKKFVKPKAEGIDGEHYDLKNHGIEKQINEAMAKGPGEHTFYYFRTKKPILDEDGKPLEVYVTLVSEKLNITG